MKNKLIGIIILLFIVGGAVAYQQFFSAPKTIVLKGYVGGEKMAFLENEEVKTLLQKKYGIELDAIKAGSIEMVKEHPAADIDFLWPSSQVALELFKANNFALVKSEVILNSPIVLYSWNLVTEKLQEQGIVEQDGESLHVTQFQRLIQDVAEGKKWADIGLDQLFGKMSITTTDPTKSNSGNMFAGLLANILHGDMVDESAIQALLPTITQIFARLGYMPASSHNLFQEYLTKGIGDKPIIVGYENQAVEFSLQNPKLWPKVKDKVRILYPRPTVWSSHPLIVLQEKGSVLLEALQDEDIQKIAWEHHGFRSGLAGIQNDPSVLDIAGIPENITYVVPMPSPQVMETIIQALQSGN